MKSLAILPALLSIVVLTSTHWPVYQSKSKEQPSVVGSWQLISYVDHQNNEQGWKKYSEDILYQKHITNSHFTWIKYSQKQDKLLGMGGGTYKIEEGKYIENIEFFFPPGSSELGQAIPFMVKMKKGKWYHTGYAKKMEINEEGQIKVVGSSKIEEVWLPVDQVGASNKKLVNCWNLSKYRDDKEDSYEKYPEFIGYIKLITPTNFVWIKYDKEGDQIYAAGSGTYQYDGQKYVENLEMVFPSNSGQVGTTIDFDIVLEDHMWKHFGYAPVLDKAKKPTDTILVDEIWEPHIQGSQEIAFTE
ncbi:MAG: hypothetical protein KI790_01090 [Cyclobacteriaceae bacterium]|nr:hypothetical protein [Cyclobacteriaceae bacterium HetDA_MAG_MS6]